MLDNRLINPLWKFAFFIRIIRIRGRRICRSRTNWILNLCLLIRIVIGRKCIITSGIYSSSLLMRGERGKRLVFYLNSILLVKACVYYQIVGHCDTLWSHWMLFCVHEFTDDGIVKIWHFFLSIVPFNIHDFNCLFKQKSQFYIKKRAILIIKLKEWMLIIK